jgi:hypothetical protein
MTAGTPDAPSPDGTSVSPSRDNDLEGLVERLVRDLRPSSPEGKLSWKDLLENATPILAASGLVMYGILTLAYSRFYSSLSVTPSEIGLGYANTLANSVGAILGLIATILVIALAISIFIVLVLSVRNIVRYIRAARAVRAKMDSPPRSMHDETGAIDVMSISSLFARLARESIVDGVLGVTFLLARRTVRFTLWAAVILAVLLAAYALPLIASNRAEAVMVGQPISAPRLPVLAIGVLPIHADPATVQPVGEKDAVSVLAELGARPQSSSPLLYLGQSGGIAVLYDSELKKATYVPLSLVVLKVHNCASDPGSTMCMTSR